MVEGIIAAGLIIALIISAFLKGEKGQSKRKVRRKGALRIIEGLPETAPPNTKTPEAKKKGFKYETEEPWPFVTQEIMTRTEKRIYRKLKSALPDFDIMGQVQLSQIVKVKKGHDFYQWFNRINRMSVDFVILNRELTPIAAIEIDDCSHRDPKRMEADAKKNKVLKTAGMTLLRWEPDKVPDEEVIARYFNSKASDCRKTAPNVAKSSVTQRNQEAATH